MNSDMSRITELESALKVSEEMLHKMSDEISELTGLLEQANADKDLLRLKLAEISALADVSINANSEPVDAPAEVIEFVPISLTDEQKEKNLKHLELINNSELFDPQWYLEQYPDIKESPKMSKKPGYHYLLFGAFEGRNPSDKFDSIFYFNQYPDVAESGLNPLVHYLLFGKVEHRLPKAS